MTEPRRSAGREPKLFGTLKADVSQVRAEVKQRGLRQGLGDTLTRLEAFYLSEDARRRLANMRRLGRFIYRVWWLAKGLLLRLTPVRRVLLALGLVLGTTIVGPIFLIAVLMLELKDKLIARDELEAGRAVQLALMPERSPAVPGWDLWLYTEPANDVGGDLIDHLQIDDRHHGVALGDVSGKALPAALLMVKLQATLRALTPQFDALSDLGAAMNRILERDFLPSGFATLVYIVLATDSGDIRVLNAGHMPPVVVRGGAIDGMELGSMALGMMPDATFSEQRVALAEGDVLVVYSDGITEAMNESGDFFGDERLRAAIQGTTGQPVEAIGTEILRALQTFVGDAPPHDDVSLMLLKRHSARA